MPDNRLVDDDHDTLTSVSIALEAEVLRALPRTPMASRAQRVSRPHYPTCNPRY